MKVYLIPSHYKDPWILKKNMDVIFPIKPCTKEFLGKVPWDSILQLKQTLQINYYFF
jgi:hypothetical protein